jgi:hypothetical protein
MDNDPATNEAFIKNGVEKINSYRSTRLQDEDHDRKKSNFEERNTLLINNYEPTFPRKLKKLNNDDVRVNYFLTFFLIYK